MTILTGASLLQCILLMKQFVVYIQFHPQKTKVKKLITPTPPSALLNFTNIMLPSYFLVACKREICNCIHNILLPLPPSSGNFVSVKLSSLNYFICFWEHLSPLINTLYEDSPTSVTFLAKFLLPVRINMHKGELCLESELPLIFKYTGCLT